MKSYMRHSTVDCLIQRTHLPIFFPANSDVLYLTVTLDYHSAMWYAFVLIYKLAGAHFQVKPVLWGLFHTLWIVEFTHTIFDTITYDWYVKLADILILTIAVAWLYSCTLYTIAFCEQYYRTLIKISGFVNWLWWHDCWYYLGYCCLHCIILLCL